MSEPNIDPPEIKMYFAHCYYCDEWDGEHQENIDNVEKPDECPKCGWTDLIISSDYFAR